MQKLLSCHFQCTYPSLSQPAGMLVLTACYRHANVDMSVTYLSQSIGATLSPHTSHIQELGRGGNDNLMNSSWDLKFCLVRSRYTTRYLDSEARRLKDACLTVLLPGCCCYYPSFLLFSEVTSTLGKHGGDFRGVICAPGRKEFQPPIARLAHE